MKLAPNYKNSTSPLSPDLKKFLDSNIDDLNSLVREAEMPTAIIVGNLGNSAFKAADLYIHLTAEKVASPLYQQCLAKPEEGRCRLVYLTQYGEGALDILVEFPGRIDTPAPAEES